MEQRDFAKQLRCNMAESVHFGARLIVEAATESPLSPGPSPTRGEG